MSKLILVVDDTPEVRELIIKILTRSGYDAVGAVHGAKALEIVATRVVDLIVTDLRMPIIDGNQLVAELNKVAQTIPVIVITSAASDVLPNPQIKKILPKPFNINELLAAVQNHI